MTLIQISGFICAALIGVSLGMIGGGGSILTVPVLVYLVGVEPVLATAYSLFIVGLSSLIGGLNYARKGMVDYKTGLVFAVPALVAVYSTRLFVIPALPEVWFRIGGLTFTKDTGILVLFATLMLGASISMIRNSSKIRVENGNEIVKPPFNFPMIFFEGTVVGLLTGLVGAGGGFLIIPALVLFARLSMKIAVGTSLFIIAIKSLLGFIGDIQADQPIDWQFLGIFSIISILGIFVGSYFSEKVDGQKLKKAFGWFVLVMGSLMIVRELWVL